MPVILVCLVNCKSNSVRVGLENRGAGIFQNERSEIHDLICRAYFVDGRNISDIDEDW